jgi:acyl dehydratase
MRFFEDTIVGERHELGSHTFTAEEIKRFAGAFDPQRFHTDEAAAEASHFGRLCASGWHTLAVWMKLNVREMQGRATRERHGPRRARIGPSPGFDELKWLKPVYVGDTISFATEVIATKPSRSRPEWGLVSIRNTGVNQRGELAISFVGHVFVERRERVPDETDRAAVSAPETRPAS